MQPFSIPVLPSTVMPRLRTRTALLASSDRSFRQRLTQTLIGLRWQVREAETGAEAWAVAETSTPEAVIVDSWLPDLDLGEFLREFRASFPKVDLLTVTGPSSDDGPRSPYRQELLYALRTSQDNDTVAWNTPGAMAASSLLGKPAVQKTPVVHAEHAIDRNAIHGLVPAPSDQSLISASAAAPVLLKEKSSSANCEMSGCERLPELVGNGEQTGEMVYKIDRGHGLHHGGEQLAFPALA